MKKIREYHIESYWAAEAVRRKKMAEFKEKFLERIIVGAFIALEVFLTYEFMRLLFEVI
jgi:hypothetical protein